MPSEPNPNLLWYIVNTYSGYELRVRDSLLARIDALGLEDSITEVRVPMEGERLIFPSYVLVKMAMRDETMRAVRSIPKVTGFGGGARPTPMSDAEMRQLLGQAGVVERSPSDYAAGDAVRVTDGPFRGHDGVVEQADAASGVVRVKVTIHGRATAFDLKPHQIAKA